MNLTPERYLETGLFISQKREEGHIFKVLILNYNFEKKFIWDGYINFPFDQVQCLFTDFDHGHGRHGFYNWRVLDTVRDQTNFTTFQRLWEQIFPEELKERMLFHMDLFSPRN